MSNSDVESENEGPLSNNPRQIVYERVAAIHLDRLTPRELASSTPPKYISPLAS